MASLLKRLSNTSSSGRHHDVSSVVQKCYRATSIIVQLPETTKDGSAGGEGNAPAISRAAASAAVAETHKCLDQLHEIVFATAFSPMERTQTNAAQSVNAGTSSISSKGPINSEGESSPSTNPSSSSSSSSSATTSATTNVNALEITSNLVKIMIQDNVNLPLLLVLSISHLEFEHRKLLVTLFKHCYKCEEAFRDYCLEKLPIIDFLAEGYTPLQRDICVNCHNLLEQFVVRDSRVADRLLRSRFLARFFEDYIVSPDFEVQSKALSLLASMLRKHPKVTAKFLKDPVNASAFFERYNNVLSSDNYVSQVQLLSLLSDLLMVRKNRKVMVAYVSEKANLMVIMKLLRHKSVSIAYEAFHVFKIFVANPAKPDRVQYVFTQNSKKLIKFMKKFQRDRDIEEPDFAEEKARIVDSLKAMAVEAAAMTDAQETG